MQGSPEEKEQASLVLLEVLEAARVVAVMLTPVAPALARLVYLQLGFTDQEFEALTWANAQWGGKLLCKHLGQSSLGNSHNHGTRSRSQYLFTYEQGHRPSSHDHTSQLYVMPCFTRMPDGFTGHGVIACCMYTSHR